MSRDHRLGHHGKTEHQPGGKAGPCKRYGRAPQLLKAAFADHVKGFFRGQGAMLIDAFFGVRLDTHTYHPAHGCCARSE